MFISKISLRMQDKFFQIISRRQSKLLESRWEWSVCWFQNRWLISLINVFSELRSSNASIKIFLVEGIIWKHHTEQIGLYSTWDPINSANIIKRIYMQYLLNGHLTYFVPCCFNSLINYDFHTLPAAFWWSTFNFTVPCNNFFYSKFRNNRLN